MKAAFPLSVVALVAGEARLKNSFNDGCLSFEVKEKNKTFFYLFFLCILLCKSYQILLSLSVVQRTTAKFPCYSGE